MQNQLQMNGRERSPHLEFKRAQVLTTKINPAYNYNGLLDKRSLRAVKDIASDCLKDGLDTYLAVSSDAVMNGIRHYSKVDLLIVGEEANLTPFIEDAKATSPKVMVLKGTDKRSRRYSIQEAQKREGGMEDYLNAQATFQITPLTVRGSFSVYGYFMTRQAYEAMAKTPVA